MTKNKNMEEAAINIGDEYTFMGHNYTIKEHTKNDTAIMHINEEALGVPRLREVPMIDLINAWVSNQSNQK